MPGLAEALKQEQGDIQQSITDTAAKFQLISQGPISMKPVALSKQEPKSKIQPDHNTPSTGEKELVSQPDPLKPPRMKGISSSVDHREQNLVDEFQKKRKKS